MDRKKILVKTFGARLKHWREKLGMSRVELEFEADLGEAMIGHYERGSRSPTLYTLEKILDGLNVTPAEFFSEEIE